MMKEVRMYVVAATFSVAGSLSLMLSCGEQGDGHGHDHDAAAGFGPSTVEDHEHDHGGVHADHDHEHAVEVTLGKAVFGDMEVEGAQGHGAVEPGKEGHLVIKLPYNDNGATMVRAWIGTEDRFTSVVGKGEYAPSHDDYDIHAIAPDPLPENAQWWVEIEKPDGTKIVGSLPIIRG